MQLTSLALGDSSNVVFSVFHKRILQDKCLGRIEIDVRELLEHQHQHVGEGEHFVSMVPMIIE